MEKHRITGIIIFISFISLLLAGPVQAMQAIAEEDLDRVTAEQGITLGMNVRTYAQADSLALYQNSGTNVDGILLSSLSMRDTAGAPFKMVNDMTLDIGSSGTKTWLMVNGMSFPDYTGNVSSSANPYVAPDGVNLSFNNLRAQDWQGASATYTLAYNVSLYGMYIGRDVNLWKSGGDYYVLNADDTFMRISNRAGGGLELVAEQAVLTRLLIIRPNSSDTHRFWVDGMLMAKNTDLDLANNSQGVFNAHYVNWPDMNGNARIGGELPTYTYSNSCPADGRAHPYCIVKTGTAFYPATIDIGSSGSDTLLQINLPMAFSTRWKHLYIDQGGGVNLDTGPSLTLNVSLWTVRATLKNTY